jgi:hypothetical protein
MIIFIVNPKWTTSLGCRAALVKQRIPFFHLIKFAVRRAKIVYPVRQNEQAPVD